MEDHLSNKIAAGEVVERPASVVKELVENGIDANSSKIRVDVEDGGLGKIRILDNGEGIEKEDRETAFYRHATSKIHSDRDLFRIRTLGFRGEALPSIASVSKMTLTSSTDGQEGETLKIEGGEIKERKASPPRQGTEIIVEDLFYNTPARLKYLKSVHTEIGHISDVINRMALSHPEIAFELYHNDKNLLKTAGQGDLLRVLHAIYGKSVVKGMKKLEASSADFQVSGYAAEPGHARSNRSYMTIVINGRYVKNIAVSKAVQAGYNTLLPIGKYPIVCLHITLNPMLIDVNVHPSKMEVRLSKEQALQKLIQDSLKSLWSYDPIVPEMKPPKQKKPAAEQLQFSFEAESASNIQEETRSSEQERQVSAYKEPEFTQLENKVNESAEKHAPENNFQVSESDRQAAENSNNKRIPSLYPIGQLHGTYILAQNEQGFYMIDQHAAQERINYEFYLRKLADPPKETQELLVPITLHLNGIEAAIIEQHTLELEKVGVFAEPFGTNTFLIRSYPSWFPAGEEKSTLEEIIEQIKEVKNIQLDKLRNDAAAMMACKAAIKANHRLQVSDMHALIEEWRKCQDPFTCPHGRPVMIQYSLYEIEKMFKRVMN
ncbi:DNA mismatch repair protein MutL [Alkalicoccus daliensis]|uniref:DNA mismatch repair protein MutL n=2 Tax=Alkalicoccus daliensis TaxID=745820 RepID=A0A1H0A9X7_9BACI|nr:DNA mismatch repair protein MutL [Alkalicoccus daliensis]